MTRLRGAPPAWDHLGCDPRELCRATGTLVRGEDDRLHADLQAGRISSCAMERLVDRHRMGAYLHHRLAAWSRGKAIPPTIVARCEESAERQQATAAACLATLTDLQPRFATAGVPVLLLKGPALAARYYGGLAHRGYGDLDLLVREPDRPVAMRLLRGAGHHRVSRALLSEAMTARFVHGFDFRGGSVGIDLHWCLSRMPGYRLDMAGIWERTASTTVEEIPVRVLAPEDELLLLLLSGFADVQRGALRLQSLVDVAMVIRAQPDRDWAAFLAARRMECTETVCRAMLRLLLGLLSLDRALPALSQAVGGGLAFDEAIAVMRPRRGGWGATSWSRAALPVSPVRYLGWWAVSLPFRAAASHPRLRRRLPVSA